MKPCKKREPTPENRTGDVVKPCRKREPTPESERWAGSLDGRKREATPEGHASALEKPWRKHRQPTPESRAGSLDKPWRKREATPESGSPGCKTARCTSSSPPLTRGQRHSPGRACASQMDGAEKPHPSAPEGTRAPASRGRSPAQPQVGLGTRAALDMFQYLAWSIRARCERSGVQPIRRIQEVLKSVTVWAMQ